jgi:hypothetical protein
MSELFDQTQIDKLKARTYPNIRGDASDLFTVLDAGVAKLVFNVARAAEFTYITPERRNIRDIAKVYEAVNRVLARVGIKLDERPSKDDFREAFAMMFHMLNENSREGAFYRDAIVVAFEELDLSPVGARHGLEIGTGKLPSR